MRCPSLATAPTRSGSTFIALAGGTAYEKQVYDFVLIPKLTDSSKTWIFASGMDASNLQSIIRFTINNTDLDANSNASLTYDGQMLTAGGGWETGSLGIRLGSIVNVSGTLYLFYSSDDGLGIGVATSTDGASWSKSGSNPILTGAGQGRNDGLAVTLPAVINESGSWTMLYAYSGLTGIRYATSSDGVSWTKGGSGDVADIGAEQSLSLFNEFHQLIKVATGDYLLLSEAGNGSNSFGIYASRAATAHGPFAMAQTAWFQKSGSVGTFDRYHVATPCLYETPAGNLKLLYSGAGTVDQPYTSNTWPGGIASVTALSENLGVSLAHFWKLSEAAGASRADSTQTFVLTDHNTVGQATEANWWGGLGAIFNTSSSRYLAHASAASLLLGDADWTIAFWMQPQTTSDHIYVSKDTDSPASSRDFTIDYHAGNLRFYLNGGGSVLVSTSVSQATRYLVVCKHDSVNNIASLQTNLNSAVTQATGGLVPDTGSGEFRVGARQYSGFEGYMEGFVSQVGIWTRCLTSNEIAELYSTGATLPYEQLTTPAASSTDVLMPQAIF